MAGDYRLTKYSEISLPGDCAAVEVESYCTIETRPVHNLSEGHMRLFIKFIYPQRSTVSFLFLLPTKQNNPFLFQSCFSTVASSPDCT